jgi:predicted phosphodiesterase
MLGVLGGAGAAFGPDGGLLLNSVAGAETLPENDMGDPLVQFGLVTDTHYGTIPDTNRPRFFKWSLPNVRQLVSEFNRLPIDFSVHLGDVIQETHNREQTLALMSALDAEFSKSKSPIHYVIGNHDLGDNSKQDFLEHTSGQVKKTRYHFDLRGYRFIILDTSFRSNGVEYDSGNFSWTDSSVPAAEMQWLDEILDEARDEGLRAVVFSHQNFGRASRGHRIRNADAVLSLFESKGNVSAIFNGHLHPGGYEFLNGIHIVTTVATVNGPDRAGCHVIIYEKGAIEVKGIGARQPGWGPLLPG